MPTDRRSSRDPEVLAEPRPLIAQAAWTAAGAVVVAAVVSIAVVAITWLPSAGTSGSAGSAIRAGILTFLAALRGGITIDGVHTSFVPLGMTLAAAALAWRTGGTLAAAAQDADEHDPRRLLALFGVQTAVFALGCTVLAAVATLGTSSVSILSAGVAALLLFGIAGGAGFVRGGSLGDAVADAVPPRVRAVGRSVAVVGLLYAAVGALLVAGSLAVHHRAVSELSAAVGGGWSGVPVLLLGVLAAPNAVIAAAGYLAGPGFAVGTGTSVTLDSATHGTVPALPLLGALPSGGAGIVVWLIAVFVPLLAAAALTFRSFASVSWRERVQDAAATVLVIALLAAVLAWLGGGGIGAGRLSRVGVPPLRLALAFTLTLGVLTAVMMGVVAGVAALRARQGEGRGAREDHLEDDVDIDDDDYDDEVYDNDEDDVVDGETVEVQVVDGPTVELGLSTMRADEGGKRAG